MVDRKAAIAVVICIAVGSIGCVDAVQRDWRPPIVGGNPDKLQFDIDLERCKDFATVATAGDPLRASELFASMILGATVGAAAGAVGGATIGGTSGAQLGATVGGTGGATVGGIGIAQYAKDEHQRRRRDATRYCLEKLRYDVITY